MANKRMALFLPWHWALYSNEQMVRAGGRIRRGLFSERQQRQGGGDTVRYRIGSGECGWLFGGDQEEVLTAGLDEFWI